MLRPGRESDYYNTSDADSRAGQPLRRLREHPPDTVNRIANEIGRRPPTSLGEAQAAAYLDGRMRRAGMRVSADAFRAPVSIGADGLVVAVLGLSSVLLYYWFPLAALVISVCSLAIAVLSAASPRAPLFARRRSSQNVIATRATNGAARWRVVLLAPLDSPPVMGRLTRLLADDWRRLIGRLAACTLLTLLAVVALSVPPAQQRLWWYAQTLPAAYLLLLALLEARMLLAPTTHGAISHAGALAVLLSSAEELSTLNQTELWAVALGATSSGAGLADLLRRYPFDREMTLFIGLEGIGSGMLSYLTREGIVGRQRPEPLLLELVAAVDADDPLINAEPRRASNKRTITWALHRTGRRALTITCLGNDGQVPYRGSPDDKPDVVEAPILDRAVRLVVGLVRGIDATNTDQPRG